MHNSALAAELNVVLSLGVAGLEADEKIEDEDQSSQHATEAIGLFSEAQTRAVQILSQVENSPASGHPIVALALQNIIVTHQQRIAQLQEYNERAAGGRHPRACGGGAARAATPPASEAETGARSLSSNLCSQLARLCHVSQSALDGLSQAAIDVLESGLQTPPDSGGLDDVAGLSDVKQALREGVLLPLRFPHLFRGVRQPTSAVLLHGPPGTGKTMMVAKLAAEAGLPLLCLAPSGLLSRWLGESEKAVRGAFEAASKLQPCIVFIDEIDALASRRGRSSEDPAGRRVLTELLIQVSALGEGNRVFLVAATNRLDDLDEALVRRFQRTIFVPLPDSASRLEFFRRASSGPDAVEHRLTALDMQGLADRTAGYSGSDLLRVLRDAALEPVREVASSAAVQAMLRGGGMGKGVAGSPRGGEGLAEGSGAAYGAPGSEGYHAMNDMEGGMGGAEDGGALGGEGAGLRLRPLVLADFLAALQRIRPSAEDGGVARTEVFSET